MPDLRPRPPRLRVKLSVALMVKINCISVEQLRLVRSTELSSRPRKPSTVPAACPCDGCAARSYGEHRGTEPTTRHPLTPLSRRYARQSVLEHLSCEGQPAVVQGLTTPFNSGVNEGRITDLRLQKRIRRAVRASRCSATACFSWPCFDAATCDGASPAHGDTSSASRKSSQGQLGQYTANRWAQLVSESWSPYLAAP